MAKAKKDNNEKTKSKAKDAHVEIGITDNHRGDAANELQLLLADEHVLYVKTRNFHWNVEGLEFGALHKFFEAQYTELAETIDAVAERIRYIGYFAMGSMQEFLNNTRLKEEAGKVTAVEMLKMLLADHEAIIRSTRNAIEVTEKKDDDAGTTDFLTGVLQQHEKMAWMIRAHLGR